MSDVGGAGEVPVEGAAGEEGPARWEKHPAYRILFDLYRQHDCSGTVDPLDPEDCAGVAAASVRALMQSGWLVDESDFHYAAVVDRRMDGLGWEVVRIRTTFERADTDRDVLVLTERRPVVVMRRRKLADGRACGEWETMPATPAMTGFERAL